jgi:hypothetical protein
MTRFQLVFRDGISRRSEFRYNNGDGEPHIEGKLIVDGETYLIRGVEWLLRREGVRGGLENMPRFICTLVAEPAEEDKLPVGSADLPPNSPLSVSAI